MEYRLLKVLPLYLFILLFASCSDINPDSDTDSSDETVPVEPIPDKPDPEEPKEPEDTGNESINPEIGNYYYEDGTWSAEVSSDKKIIGIVYWVGDPASDDEALKEEHPECTHGLVVSLNQNYSAWQKSMEAYKSTVSSWLSENETGYPRPYVAFEEESLNARLGYSYTKAIEAFNAAPENAGFEVEAIEMVGAYREKVPAPSSSSDWYLPSPKELSLMCTGEFDGYLRNIFLPAIDMRTRLNKILDDIDGTYWLNGGVYWTSAEYDDRGTYPRAWMSAWNVYFEDGEVFVSFKDFQSACCRYVLAF